MTNAECCFVWLSGRANFVAMSGKGGPKPTGYAKFSEGSLSSDNSQGYLLVKDFEHIVPAEMM